MRCSQLAKQHGDQLIPTVKSFRPALRFMLSDRSRKCPPIDQTKQLRKATRYRYHRFTSGLPVMPALPRRFVIWFSLHYSKPESFSDAVLDKCGRWGIFIGIAPDRHADVHKFATAYCDTVSH